MSFKPQAITVTGASTQILPPTSPDPALITLWLATTAYVVGDVVSVDNSRALYWAVAAGTTAGVEPSELGLSVLSVFRR